MSSQASVIVSTIGLMATRSLLILVIALSVLILLECFLVLNLNSIYVFLPDAPCSISLIFHAVYIGKSGGGEDPWPLPLDPISFIFMQVLTKILSNDMFFPNTQGLVPVWEILDPPLVWMCNFLG